MHVTQTKPWCEQSRTKYSSLPFKQLFFCWKEILTNQFLPLLPTEVLLSWKKVLARTVCAAKLKSTVKKFQTSRNQGACKFRFKSYAEYSCWQISALGLMYRIFGLIYFKVHFWVPACELVLFEQFVDDAGSGWQETRTQGCPISERWRLYNQCNIASLNPQWITVMWRCINASFSRWQGNHALKPGSDEMAPSGTAKLTAFATLTSSEILSKVLNRCVTWHWACDCSFHCFQHF